MANKTDGKGHRRDLAAALMFFFTLLFAALYEFWETPGTLVAGIIMGIVSTILTYFFINSYLLEKGMSNIARVIISSLTCIALLAILLLKATR